MQNVGFIGAGKAAVSIGKYLVENGVPVSGYYDISRVSADDAATFTDTTAYEAVAGVVSDSDIIFIATPDDVISSVWESLKNFDISGKIIGIFSGSLSSDLFLGIDDTGAAGASVHPMYAFSDKYSNHEKLNNACFTVEGDETAVTVFKGLFKPLGHSVTVIETKDKKRYHAAASVASNLMIGLYDMSLSMLRDCGFSEKEAAKLLRPLIEKNISAMLDSTPDKALTGPIERGDAKTIEGHIKSMSEDERKIYIPIAKRLIEISKRKNPDRDYMEIQSLLNQPIGSNP